MSLKRTVNFSQSQASVTLDAIRGTAAILVLLSHWKNQFFLPYLSLPSKTGLNILYRIMEVGHQAVLVFFVLSGYLISNSIFRSLERGDWKWSTYLYHRLVRLWIVLIPGILVGGIWD